MIDVSSNENPYCLPKQAVFDVLSQLQHIALNRYPEADADTLVSLYAQAHGLSASNVICGNGSDDLIDLVYKAFTGQDDLVMALEPSFIMYKRVADIHRRAFRTCKVKDLYRVIESENPRVCFICNPNNPTGAMIPKEDLVTLFSFSETVFIVDEAYIEFSDSSVTSCLPLIEAYPNVIVLRTLSKAYGLAGLRVGFGVSHPENIKRLASVKLPYNVSSLSQAIAIRMLEADHQQRCKEEVALIKAERSRLYNALSQMPYLEVKPSQANFLWVKVPDEGFSVEALSAYLRQKQIKIRIFDDGAYRAFFRISIGTPEENHTVLQAIHAFIKGGPKHD